MAHLFVPTPSDRELPVIFNVDGAVGAFPAENKREDVLLVQLAFHVIARSPFAETPPEVLTTAKAVKLTGHMDPETIAAIKALQDDERTHGMPGQIVDGRVSPARGGCCYAKNGVWTIAFLNKSIQRRNVAIWPRIDRIMGCPTELKEMVTRTVAGKP
jgi:hypothetical protein